MAAYNKAKIKPSYAEKCSGFWNCLGHVTKVAGADLIGAAAGVKAVKEVATVLNVATGGTGGTAVVVAGGVIAGAGASYAAARTVNQEHTPDSLKYGYLQITIPEDFLYLSNIGIEHNDVLHNNFFYNSSLTEYTQNLSLEQAEVIYSEQMQEARNIINSLSAEYVSSGFDYQTFTTNLYENNFLSSDLKDILNLFLEVYYSCESEEEITEIINYYMSEISIFELDLTDKEALISAFMVASESPFYFLNS